MKKLWYSAIALAFSLSLVCLPVLAQEAPAEYDPQTVVKDETVYVTLTSTGEAKETIVVNRLEAGKLGSYEDYGSYSDIVNLSGGESPVQDGDKLTWNLDAYPEGFYYQGKVENGQIPFHMTVSYALDGEPISPEELAGKSGKVEMTLSIKTNPDAQTYFQNNFMCQVQVPLDLSMASDVAAPGAMAKVISGKTATLAYMAMPGSEAEYTVSFIAKEFHMDSIMATCSQSDVSGILGTDLNTIRDGINQLKDGQDQIISGTQQLKNGLGSLGTGVGQLKDGANSIKSGADGLASGLHQYADGLEQSIADLAPIIQALEGAAQNPPDFDGLKTGLAGILGSMGQLAMQLPDGQEKVQILQSIQGIQTQLEGMSGQLEQFQTLFGQLSALADDLGKMDDAVSAGKELAAGADGLAAGVGELRDGLSSLHSNILGLPGQVQKLIDGQTGIRNGIQEATSVFDQFGNLGEGEIVSFAAPGKIVPRSVQFLLTTDAITVPAE